MSLLWTQSEAPQAASSNHQAKTEADVPEDHQKGAFGVNRIDQLKEAILQAELLDSDVVILPKEYAEDMIKAYTRTPELIALSMLESYRGKKPSDPEEVTPGTIRGRISAIRLMRMLMGTSLKESLDLFEQAIYNILDR